MKPSAEELADLRADALEDAAFREAMRSASACAAQWEREHPTSTATLLRAVDQLTRLFPALRTDLRPTPGDRFPLL